MGRHSYQLWIHETGGWLLAGTFRASGANCREISQSLRRLYPNLDLTKVEFARVARGGFVGVRCRAEEEQSPQPPTVVGTEQR
jgi:hypothetical protein